MPARGRSVTQLGVCLDRIHGLASAAPGLPRRRSPESWRRRGLCGDHAAGVEPSSPVSAVDPDPPHVRSDEVARVEAALFLAREPVSARRLAKLARVADGTRARALVLELRQMQDAAGSAMRVEQIAGGFQVLTRTSFGPWVRRVASGSARGRLTTAALETLAIVAYRQPVTRAEVESIRGVGSEEMLRQLMERDLVAIGGRVEELGRPNVYVTTRHFLAAFGLARLEDLPPIESLLDRPEAGKASAPAAEGSGDG